MDEGAGRGRARLGVQRAAELVDDAVALGDLREERGLLAHPQVLVPHTLQLWGRYGARDEACPISTG